VVYHLYPQTYISFCKIVAFIGVRILFYDHSAMWKVVTFKLYAENVALPAVFYL